MGARLPLPAGLSRGSTVTVSIDGEPVAAYLGESVAAVLMAEGELTTRTTKTGEPRGVFCGMGVCFDCLVIVDGIPSTRSCMTWVAQGMQIQRQAGPGNPL